MEKTICFSSSEKQFTFASVFEKNKYDENMQISSSFTKFAKIFNFVKIKFNPFLPQNSFERADNIPIMMGMKKSDFPKNTLTIKIINK